MQSEFVSNVGVNGSDHISNGFTDYFLYYVESIDAAIMLHISLGRLLRINKYGAF